MTALADWLGRTEQRDNDPDKTRACVAAGDPIVIVDKAGFIYYPVTTTVPSGPAGNPLLVQHCEQEVEVTGTLMTRGREHAVIIDKVAAYSPGKPGKQK